MCVDISLIFFFFNDTATTEIYTLSLHDALPISVSTLSEGVDGTVRRSVARVAATSLCTSPPPVAHASADRDRKSTRLNSSHANISYAVFCLKKKITNNTLIF